MGIHQPLAPTYGFPHRLEVVTSGICELLRLCDELLFLQLAAVILGLKLLAFRLGCLVFVTSVPEVNVSV